MFLSDAEIEKLINEPKPLPLDYRKRLILSVVPGLAHKSCKIELEGKNGNHFQILIRQALIDPLNFSVILVYCKKNSNETFKLRRYNGNNHPHTNKIDKEYLEKKFHIHYATARYQESGFKEEDFAVHTDRYASLHEAIECLLSDCSFIKPDVYSFGELF